jgi:hypothetical protein
MKVTVTNTQSMCEVNLVGADLNSQLKKWAQN